MKLSLFAALLLSLTLVGLASASADNPEPTETRVLAGWTVPVSTQLLANDPPGMKHVLEVLEAHLGEIVRVVPSAALRELQKVPLWISPEYPGTKPKAEYHPNVEWLRSQGRNPAMAKAVEFTNTRIFDAETRRMPVFVLHELAHAYHDRVLGFEEPRVIAAYEKAKAGGQYDRVERRDSEGRKSFDRAYAITNPREYFAECTEAYFGRNDFFPFTREELEQTDPEMCALLKELWSFSVRQPSARCTHHSAPESKATLDRADDVPWVADASRVFGPASRRAANVDTTFDYESAHRRRVFLDASVLS
jgi:hypothetical protein